MDFYLLNTPVSSKTAKQIEDWSLKNIEDQYESHITENPNGTFSVSLPENFEALADQILEKFSDYKIPPKNTYLGEGILYKSAKLTDVVSGAYFNSSPNASGWVVNNRTSKLFSEFNIGQYETYEFPLIHKRTMYTEYVFLAFNNKADHFVDFAKSSFYISDFMSLEDDKTPVQIKTKEEFYDKWKELRDHDDLLFLEFDSLVFKSHFNQDMFCFQELPFTGTYASERLVNRLQQEGITGLNFLRRKMNV